MTTREVEPLGAAFDATVELPGSKSITNRALLAAALATGSSELQRFLVADDTTAMRGCLDALGVAVSDAPGGVRVTGTEGRLPRQDAALDARQSGTTARFVLPLLGLGAGPYHLDGHTQLRSRPMGDGIDALRSLGASVQASGVTDHLPLDVLGGPVTGGSVEVAGSVSSQFLSGLLLAGPAMRDGLAVRVRGDLVSRPYVEMTASVVRAFGGSVEVRGDTWVVAPGAYRGTTYSIEPDASAASYFFAAAAVCDGRVRVDGLSERSLQGDVAFVDVLERMGARVERGADHLTVEGTGTLHGIEVDLRDLSDTAPTLAVVAAFADSPTEVRGIGFIRRKETDRIAAVVRELQRCGVDAAEVDDGFVVRPSDAPHGAVVDTYDDHRMAMSFAVLGSRVPGVVIRDPECVAKTFPGFWDALDSLRAARGDR